MMKRWIVSLLAIVLVLSGCGGGQGEHTDEQPELTPRPDALTPSGQETPAPSDRPDMGVTEEPETPPEEETLVSLSWERMSTGEWPLDCTLETLQFAGSEDETLRSANEELHAFTAHEWQRYQDCAALNEDERLENGASWGDVWAYPVTGERYLNAIWTQRERMHFRIAEEEPWSLVWSMVYDTEEKRMISLDEALALANTDPGELEQAVWEYTSEHQLGKCENTSSLAFYMTDEDIPVFMIGAIVYQDGAPTSWPTFFTWTDGAVEWTVEHPLPLYLVDTHHQDELSCLKGMGQYDGAAVISEMEAADILSEIYEVQEYLSQGMRMMFDGSSEWINEEYCVCIALGTDHEENFVREAYYAVSYDTVYRLNSVTGAWEEVGFG